MNKIMAKKKIMLIENEKVMREGLRTLIENIIQGFTVCYEADHGRDALQALDYTKPDLIITDIRMPEMDGIEFIRRLRDIEPVLPVIILSGFSDFEYTKQAIRYKVSDYLLKPIDRRELAAVLDKYKAMESGDSKEGVVEAGKEKQVIERIKEIVRNNVQESVSLQYIADHIHLNPKYISYLFKNETGQYYSDYVSEVRMNKAREMLQNTSLKVYEIASLIGYESAKTFMLAFKTKYGCTPTEYRNQSR